LSQGRGEENAIAVVCRALECGINFIDTAEAYGTEVVVGKALRVSGQPRENVVLSTKVSLRSAGSDQRRDGAALREAVNAGLQRLQTDYVDVLHLHGVRAADYDYARETLMPTLQALQSEGKIRFPGITEAFAPDPGHAMLQRAVQDDCWDVMMVGFNLLNQCARERVFSRTQQKNIGILDMFAVRRALHDTAALQAVMQELVERGQVSDADFDPAHPLHFLLTDGVATSIPDAAYRFCREEPGIHVVLSGTGSIAHLEENLRSLTGPPLPPAITERLRQLFARVDSVSGN
jgi:aryl-alcohol dehydrogenase-like predicted oxidoreductase